MSIEITIIPPQGDPLVLDPIGVEGAIGSNGWTPVLSIEFDGQRAVQKVVDWAGGEGTKPAVGQYVGLGSTLVDDIADGADIRGAQGVQGPQGDPGQIITSGQILTGSGVPDNGTGVDNDLYIDNLTADVYQKQSGVWVLQVNIKGPKGDKGDQGNPGVAGTAGADGADIIIGTGVPANGLGNVGDLYIEGTTFTLYQKTGSSVWSSFGSFRGAAGISFRVVPGAPDNAIGQNGDSWMDSITGDIYVKNAGAYTFAINCKGPEGDPGPQGIQGIQGPAGSSTLFGTGAPASGLGSDGDSYIDTATYDLYTKSAGSWTNRGSLKGANGTNGIGNAIFTGAGAPGVISGSIDGDIYIDTTSGNVHQKSGGVWSGAIMNIRGPAGEQGPQGIQGIQGNPGAAGTSILAGDGAPTNGVGNNGDVYINKLNGDFFGPKASGTWPTSTLNLKGVQGDPGDTGAPGAPGSNFLSGTGVPGSGTGANGDTYLNVSNGDVYGPKSGGAWGSPIGSLRGPQGPQGIQGIQGNAGTRGSVWYSGAASPPDAQAGQINGDYYMVTGTGQIWKLVSGTWADQGFAIKGTAGAAGTRGSLWFVSESTLPAGTFNTGDLVLINSSGDIYQYGGSSWGVVANIKGPQGEAGTAGTNGTNGTNGDEGWTPTIAIVSDGARRVMQIVDWVGGTGTKPSTTNQFVGASGIVSSAAAAVDIRGADGAQGAAGPSNLPMTSVSAARTITASDKGTCLFHPAADTTARVWTINNDAAAPNAWTNGDTVTFLNQNGAGNISIAISGSGAVLRQVGTTNTGTRTLAANGMATAVRAGDGLTWYINGSGLS